MLAINPCPPIPARPSPRHCLVTSKFTHDAAEVLDLSIEGVAGPIGVTPNHPIWSDDRREFVRADDLSPGESLLDAQGARVAVREITARFGLTEVFNLEVDGEHVYHVSSASVLVHNSCELHHMVPVAMGSGVPRGSSILTSLGTKEHRRLHKAMAEHLSHYKKGGITTDYRRHGGRAVQSTFSRAERQAALTKFYKTYKDGKYYEQYRAELKTIEEAGDFK